MPYFYVVGGAVRDAILGVKPTDIDYMVVGATPEWMLENGYTQVGADFPVFLKDGEEYALARTERKTGAGYHGFDVHADPSVTLEQDLERRDLTINSMAVKRCDWADFLDACEKHRKDCNFGDILDDFVYNYKDHIFDKVIMMNGGAFKEDPVRVFRAVRMRHTLPEGEGCRFVGDDWDYSARTWKAMEEMVASDDFKELTPERVAQELLKAAHKCRDLQQFAFFMHDIEALGALPAVIDGPQDDFPDFGVPLTEFRREQGLNENHVVAYLMLCMKDVDLKERAKRCKAKRYSNDAIAYGKAVVTLYEAYGCDKQCSTRGLMTSQKFLETAAACSANAFKGALAFAMSLNLIAPENCQILFSAFATNMEVNAEHLTEEQRATLSGKALGDAIKEKRAEFLDDVRRDLKGHRNIT